MTEKENTMTDTQGFGDRPDDEVDDDPQGMKGQLDDSMNGLEEDDNEGEASRGIPQG